MYNVLYTDAVHSFATSAPEPNEATRTHHKLAKSATLEGVVGGTPDGICKARG